MSVRSSTLLVFASMAFAFGCSQEPEPKTPLEVLAAEASGATQLPPGSAAGRSARLKPGEPMALWLGRGASGEYFIRTTTKQNTHRFQGRVRALNGDVTNFRPTRMDHKDRFKLDGQDVVFDITTRAEEDGFDFGVTKEACVEMTVRIDGKHDHEHVLVGEKEVKPASHHFVVCPK